MTKAIRFWSYATSRWATYQLAVIAVFLCAEMGLFGKGSLREGDAWRFGRTDLSGWAAHFWAIALVAPGVWVWRSTVRCWIAQALCFLNGLGDGSVDRSITWRRAVLATLLLIAMATLWVAANVQSVIDEFGDGSNYIVDDDPPPSR